MFNELCLISLISQSDESLNINLLKKYIRVPSRTLWRYLEDLRSVGFLKETTIKKNNKDHFILFPEILSKDGYILVEEYLINNLSAGTNCGEESRLYRLACLLLINIGNFKNVDYFDDEDSVFLVASVLIHSIHQYHD